MAEAFEILGIPEMDMALHAVIGTIRNQVAEALYQEALRILAIAKSRTPVKSGALQATGQVTRPVITSTEISVTISFGDETVRYAIPVHERTYVRHISGQSKYLESVILEESGSFAGNILNRVVV